MLVEAGYDADPVKCRARSNLARAVKPKDRGTSPADTAVGDVDAAFASAPVKVDVEYTTPLQTHAMMEPHATIALWDGDSSLCTPPTRCRTAGRRSWPRR